MTKYSTAASRREGLKKPKQTHPIWRGIGCLLIIIITLISISAAKLTIDYGLKSGWAIPYQLLGNPSLPDYFYKVPALVSIFGPITLVTNFYAYLATTIIYLILLGGLASFGYATAYSFIGPPRWGPLDVPPPNIRSKRYKR